MAKKREYVDFKLYLTGAAEGACQVALLPTPEVGETVLPVTVPAEKAPDAAELAYLEGKSITVGNLAKLGRKLADCLLPEGTIRNLFQQAYNEAGNRDAGVRLRLVIADYDLKQWPWEFVYYDPPGQLDPMAGFLALDGRISIVRHEPLPRPHPSAGQALGDLSKVKMLVAAASPDASDLKLQPLNVDTEVDTIMDAVAGFDLEGVQIAAEPLKNVHREQLHQALLGKPQIFHFSGHGYVDFVRDDLKRDPAKEDVFLLLSREGAAGQADLLTGADLVPWLQAANVRLAILGACYSGKRSERYPWDGMAGALVGGGVPAVITMQHEVIDTHAVAFSRAFYTALGLGLSLDEAMLSGRMAMREVTSGEKEQKINLEWGVPVLYSRLSDGALFPERMERATESAEVFRKVFRQTVTEAQKGNLIGVKVELIKNGVHIIQKVKEATGDVTGIKAGSAGAGANILVEQEIGVIEEGSTVIGGVFNEL